MLNFSVRIGRLGLNTTRLVQLLLFIRPGGKALLSLVLICTGQNHRCQPSSPPYAEERLLLWFRLFRNSLSVTLIKTRLG